MSKMLYELSDPVGLIGVILLLIAYFFLSTGRWIQNGERDANQNNNQQ